MAETTPKRACRNPVHDCKWLDLDGSDRIKEISRQDGNSLLARGAFGEVSITIDVKSGWRLAVIKTIQQATVSTNNWDRNAKRMLSNEVFNEIMALRLLSPHSNVVNFLGLLISDSKSLSLAFEYCPLDLHMLLEKRKTLLPMNICKTMARDILSGLEHCHANEVLHRDVKPGNLLISSKGRLQLCDFGLAKPCPSLLNTLPTIVTKSMGTKGLCTLYYRAPEVLLGGQANHASVDMYSAGLVVCELLTGGRPLFRGEGVIDQLGRIFSVLGTPTETLWPGAKDLPDYGKVKFVHQEPQPLFHVIPRIQEAPCLHDWLSSLVCLDPEKRLSASQALQHDLFATAPLLPAPYEFIAQSVIPAELREPSVIFSSPEVNDVTLVVARKRALKLADSRRYYFETDMPQTLSLIESCREISCSLAASRQQTHG